MQSETRVLPDLCSAHEVTFLVEASWSEPDSLIPDFFGLTVGVEKFSVDSLVSDNLKYKMFRAFHILAHKN